MEIYFHKNFKKALAKQPIKIQEKFFKAIEIFQDNPYHPKLNNHSLQGELKNFRSLDVTGDVRAHYRIGEKDNQIILVNIGTHPKLYKK